MSAAPNLTGRRFGNLLVLERHGKSNDGKLIWLCQCDCGIIAPKRAKKLLYGKEMYCGDNHPTKVCTICKEEKMKATDYHKNTVKGTKTISPMCKMCKAKWYKDNEVRLKEKSKILMQDPEYKKRKKEVSYKSRNKPENKTRAKLQKLEYTKRPEVRARENKIHQSRKKNDMNYNIKRRLRWRIRDVFKALGMDGKKYKYKSSLVLLGCDMDFFKSYIESKFTDGMCWGKISQIHIDHIVPCSQFDLTKLEDQIKCSHYSNLQPLWWIDNLTKGSKYTPTTSIDS